MYSVLTGIQGVPVEGAKGYITEGSDALHRRKVVVKEKVELRGDTLRAEIKDQGDG